MANPPAPYSVLNPETNSLSPSEKSKGVRLVSASLEISQIKKIKGFNIIIKQKFLPNKKLLNLKCA